MGLVNDFRLIATILAAMFLISIDCLGDSLDQEDGQDWPSYGRTYNEFHYSPLDQINKDNVGKLGLEWFYDLPPVVSAFTAPLAVDGVLYFSYGLGVVYAIDAKTRKLLWKYDPEVYKSAGRKKMRLAWGVRGIAYLDGMIYTGTIDGRLLAIYAESGELAWSVETTEEDDQRYITGPPWVYKNTVVIGHGGADFGVRGYVTAYNAKTGKMRWRFYTVPGDPAKGFENPAMAMAAKTWSGTWWRSGGGGTVWHAMAYDLKYDRLYIGTGNGSPWNHKIRSKGKGDNLFLASIVALDADTGKYIWHYQLNPGESWDYNANMDIQLADLDVGDEKRPVLMQAPKNGFFYVLDRITGKLISAEKIANVTWAERIDLSTGRPVENPSARYPGGSSFLMCPSQFGAHNLASMSFNPKTGLVYIPKSEMCMVYSDPPGGVAAWIPPNKYLVNLGIGPGTEKIDVPDPWSSLLAWDPIQKKARWEVKLPSINNGGTATTAGDIVFQGTVTGEFVAYAADTGEKLWSFDAQAGIQGSPITYMVDGRQFVTVVAGWRHVGTGVGLDPEWSYRTQQRRVLTFSLAGEAGLPSSARVEQPVLDDPAFKVDSGKAAIGMGIYEQTCFICHGSLLHAGGAAPDLRRSSMALSQEALKSVLRGSLAALGMPAYEELSADQIEGLQHYIRQRSREAMADQLKDRGQLEAVDDQ